MKHYLGKFSKTAGALCLAFVLLAPVPAIAQQEPAAPAPTAVQQIREGIDAPGRVQDPEGQINRLITAVVNLLSWIVGVVSVIMIIIGGFKYVLSSGDSNSTNAAKNTILFALIGLVIVALAQALVRFVLDRAAPPPGTPGT
jgi:ABC-type Fe3+ transport system permease subunit